MVGCAAAGVAPARRCSGGLGARTAARRRGSLSGRRAPRCPAVRGPAVGRSLRLRGVGPRLLGDGRGHGEPGLLQPLRHPRRQRLGGAGVGPQVLGQRRGGGLLPRKPGGGLLLVLGVQTHLVLRFGPALGVDDDARGQPRPRVRFVGGRTQLLQQRHHGRRGPDRAGGADQLLAVADLADPGQVGARRGPGGGEVRDELVPARGGLGGGEQPVPQGVDRLLDALLALLLPGTLGEAVAGGGGHGFSSRMRWPVDSPSEPTQRTPRGPPGNPARAGHSLLACPHDQNAAGSDRRGTVHLHRAPGAPGRAHRGFGLGRGLLRAVVHPAGGPLRVPDPVPAGHRVRAARLVDLVLAGAGPLPGRRGGRGGAGPGDRRIPGRAGAGHG
ncbi:Uncharacterised protein [Rothia kristinae]|nr:Uncharacterised protein [Rothia kristinae]